MSKKQKITAINYDHENKIVSLELRRKLPAAGYGAQELIELLNDWDRPTNEAWDSVFQSKEIKFKNEEAIPDSPFSTGTVAITLPFEITYTIK